ncbi:MAG: divalent metal cation transporter MntH [Actinomycetota bacterium]|jgi:manganese transport protein
MTTGTSKTASLRPTLGKLGPALVAGVAYLDPGNFASNLASGALFNYSLVWVVLLANATAWFVQYLAAKLAIGTGESLTGVLSGRFKTQFARLAYWLQAEVVILATEIAEVVGGAVALNILFGLPLGAGAVITAMISMIILASQGKARGFFTAFIIALTIVTSAGIIAAVNFGLLEPQALFAGMVPRIQSQAELLVTLGMLGATVMPHAIYSHSAFVRDKFGTVGNAPARRVLLKVTRVDVTLALGIAGFVNLCLLLIGATVFPAGAEVKDPIYETFQRLFETVSPLLAVMFALALLASGLASSAVGAYAGGEVMGSMINRQISPWVRRAITVVPAVAIMLFTTSPSQVLLFSQVLLSFGLPFALIPLVYLTSQKKLMAELVNTKRTVILGVAIAIALVCLNLKLVFDTMIGLFA